MGDDQEKRWVSMQEIAKAMRELQLVQKRTPSGSMSIAQPSVSLSQLKAAKSSWITKMETGLIIESLISEPSPEARTRIEDDDESA